MGPQVEYCVPNSQSILAAVAAACNHNQMTFLLLSDLPGLLLQAHNSAVAIGPGGGAIVSVLDDDSLLTGVAAGQKDNNLPGLSM